MHIRVDEEYYTGEVDCFSKKVQEVENYLGDFFSTYSDLFSAVEFGEHLGQVLIGKADEFYYTIKEELKSFMIDVKSQTSDFVEDIVEDDVLS